MNSVPDSDYVPTPVEAERQRRIRVLLYAYAYEFENVSLVSDHVFDTLCSEVDVSINTGRHDEWFREHFAAYTGMWIRNFPDIEGVCSLYYRLYPKKKKKAIKNYLSVCPLCKGDADNGHDREYPPNPYLCTKCDK